MVLDTKFVVAAGRSFIGRKPCRSNPALSIELESRFIVATFPGGRDTLPQKSAK